ncbi:MAG: hypothetical protein ACC657_04845 [Thiohalomonadales bacterium]
MLYKFGILLIFTLCACSTTNNKQFIYTGSLELYPAVLYLFEEMHARVDKFDLKSNTFLSSRIYNKKLNIKYNVKVTYKNKIIKTELIDVRQPQSHHKKMWVPYSLNNFFPLNDKEIVKPINTELLAILKDTKKYTEIKTDILNELGFHYAVTSKMSKPDVNKWIATYMAGKKFKLYLNNYDPEFRKNDTHTAPYKKYIAHFRYNSQKWVKSDFDLDLYTNNPSYGDMPLNSQITTLAEFIKAKVQVYIVSFGFSFDQLVPEI